jgi:hypothetical protein
MFYSHYGRITFGILAMISDVANIKAVFVKPTAAIDCFEGS